MNIYIIFVAAKYYLVNSSVSKPSYKEKIAYSKKRKIV